MGNSPSSASEGESPDDERRSEDVERCMTALTSHLETGMYRPLAILPRGDRDSDDATLGVLWHDLGSNVPKFAPVTSIERENFERLDDETRARFAALRGDRTEMGARLGVGGLCELVQATLATEEGKVDVFDDTSAFRP